MARGENGTPGETSASRSKARSLLLGSYRPDSRARREQTAELTAEAEARQRAAEEAQRAADELALRADEWELAADQQHIPYFNRQSPDYQQLYQAFAEAWVGSGLEADAGIGWIRTLRSVPYGNSLEKDIKTAVRHDKAGISPRFAQGFVSHQKRVSTKQLVGYKALIDDGKLTDVDEALHWFRRDFKFDEVEDWLPFTKDPLVAFNWSHYDFDRESCLLWYKASDGDPHLAHLAHGLDWTPERLQAWGERVPTSVLSRQGVLADITALNFAVEDLGAWEAQGFEPNLEDGHGSRYYQVNIRPRSMGDVLRLAKLGLSPEQAGVLAARRLQQNQQFSAGQYNHLPESQVLEWQQTGLRPTECYHYFQAGLLPEEAKRWYKRGIPANAAALYAEVGLTPDGELPAIPEGVQTN